MTTRSSRDRNLRGGEVAGTPMIAALGASYAVAFTRASQKSRLSPLGAPQTPTGPRSFQARTSAAEGGRLRDAFGAARRRPDRCKIQDQELKTESLACLINSAGSSTYPTRKSVRTTRATPFRTPLISLIFRCGNIRGDGCRDRRAYVPFRLLRRVLCLNAQDTQVAQSREVTVVRDERIGTNRQRARRLDRICQLQLASGPKPSRTFCNLSVQVHNEP